MINNITIPDYLIFYKMDIKTRNNILLYKYGLSIYKWFNNFNTKFDKYDPLLAKPIKASTDLSPIATTEPNNFPRVSVCLVFTGSAVS